MTVYVSKALSCRTKTLMPCPGARSSFADACNDPERSRGDTVQQLSWALLALSSFFFLSRLLSRIICLGGAGFACDDWMVVASYLALLGIAVCTQLACESGLGQDDYRLGLGQMQGLLRVVFRLSRRGHETL